MTPLHPSTDTARRRLSIPRGAGEFAHRYAILAIFAAIVAVFSALKPDVYPTVANAQAIASSQAVVALLALAATLPLVVGEFDISLGFQLGLAQTLCAGLIIKQGMPPAAVVLIVLAIGVGIGLVNGIVIAKARLNSFVVTLGTGTLVLGANQWYSKDLVISGSLPGWLTGVGQKEAGGVPVPLILVLAACLLLWLAFEYTTWGRECHATGGNARAALLAGVRTERLVIEIFVLAGLLSAVSGCLSVAVLGSASPVVGLGQLLPAYAAAFLGATAIRPGRFNAIGTTVAIYLLASGITGLQELNYTDIYIEQLFYGGALLLAVGLSAFVGRRKRV